jgi:hypothetical protein
MALTLVVGLGQGVLEKQGTKGIGMYCDFGRPYFFQTSI